MERRSFIEKMFWGAGILASASLHPVYPFRKSTHYTNFVIIFTDDQGYADLGCYGAPEIRTPNIDHMRTEGMKFTNFYVASSVCSPSRAALLTGCYPKRLCINDVFWPQEDPWCPGDNWKLGLNPNEITLPELLRTKGYATACFGKWHLGYQEPFLPTNQGFDEYFGVPFSNDMAPIPSNKRYKSGTKYAWLMEGNKILEGQKPIENQSVLTTTYTERAEQFLTANAQEKKPFFLYLAHSMPHLPLAYSPEFADSGGGDYGAAIAEIDWSTGRILRKLKELGIDNNTMVVFTSDNGPWLTKGVGSADPLLGGKGETTEGGFRVPCIMRWPGVIPANSTCSHMVTAMDFYPTFSGIADIDLNEHLPKNHRIDGKNIVSLMRNDTGVTSPYNAFLYYHRDGSLQAIRSGKWKYHLDVPKPSFGEINANRDTLFDLAEDPGETTNLRDGNDSVVASLTKLANEIHNEIIANQRPVGSIDNINIRHVHSGITPPLNSSVKIPGKYTLQGKVVKQANCPTPKVSVSKDGIRIRILE